MEDLQLVSSSPAGNSYTLLRLCFGTHRMILAGPFQLSIFYDSGDHFRLTSLKSKALR